MVTEVLRLLSYCSRIYLFLHYSNIGVTKMVALNRTMHGMKESDVSITERNLHVELLLIFFNNEILKIR
jgi:hypothetical protein